VMSGAAKHLISADLIHDSLARPRGPLFSFIFEFNLLKDLAA
jgi:hypothetical protein